MSFEEQLINLVKENEHLFNTKSRSYKNTTKRAVSWDNISSILKRPVQECKQRWRSLRDRFSREHKSLNSLASGSGAVADPEDKWEFYDLLEFLIPSLTTRRQIGNIVLEEEEQNSPPPVLPEQNETVAVPKIKRAVKRHAAQQTFDNFMNGLNKSIASLSQASDDIDMEFMQNMAKKMKPLPETIRLQLHERILGLINQELLSFLSE